MARRYRTAIEPSTDFGVLADSQAKLPKFFAFGNLAVGFIAVGNVAVGVVAVGASLAVGPIAIGINSVGWVLALGLNAVGTLCGALINGAGAAGGAGVNGIGTHFFAFVNLSQSIFPAAFGAVLQAALALRMTLKSSAQAQDPSEARKKLSELASGAVDRGIVEGWVVQWGGDTVRIRDRGRFEAELALPIERRANVDALRSLPSKTAMLFSVRVTEEPTFAGIKGDYRSAPDMTRVLWADSIELPPPPLPFWQKPGAMRAMTQWSLWLGACISAVVLALRLLLG